MVKENVLPLEDDIKTVVETIAKLEVKYGRKLKIDCNVINYESLCTATIAHIIMLERKRAGDVAEAELTFYINRRNEEIPEEVLETLTPQQRKSIKTLDVFQIPGKRTRSVPILLTKTMKENIDLIIACRDDLKIPITNPLLFARPSTDEPFDGGKCLDKIKKLCNLKRPEMLTSTGMRHHIATMSQLHAKRNDQYTEHLAGFLGHDIAVHAKNYRLPLQVLQKAVVGSQLMKYEPHRNRSPSQIIDTEEQFVVPRGEVSEQIIKLNEKANEKSSEFSKNKTVESEENSEQETNLKENSKDNEEKSKEENEEDDNKKSDEENEDDSKKSEKENEEDDTKESEGNNGEDDNKKSEKKEQKDDREESIENYKEKSKAKKQVKLQEINYKDDLNNVPEEPIISKLNKIDFRENHKYGNIQTRFKKKTVDQTETKEKNNKKVTKQRKQN